MPLSPRISSLSQRKATLHVLALLAFLLTALLGPPAQAQGWTITYAITGTTAYNITRPDGTKLSETFAWGSLNDSYFGRFGAIAPAGGSLSEVGTGSATATLTWNGGGTGQPAPQSIWLVEDPSAGYVTTCPQSTTATISGTASDGLGDAAPKVYVSSGYSATSEPPPSTATPPPNWKKMPVSGGTVTYTVSLSCSATVTVPANASSVPCWLGHSLAVSIHAQPYNFRQVHNPTVDNVGGNLQFFWGWSSTDGDVTHLSACTVYEYITWGGDGKAGTTVDGKPAWAPNHPPVGAGSQGGTYAYPSPVILPNPTQAQNKGNAVIGTANDVFSSPNFIQPCQGPTATWTGHQIYYFDDSVTGETKTKMPAPNATDAEDDIVRAVTQRSLHTWKYTVTTRGVSASISPLP